MTPADGELVPMAMVVRDGVLLYMACSLIQGEGEARKRGKTTRVRQRGRVDDVL